MDLCPIGFPGFILLLISKSQKNTNLATRLTVAPSNVLSRVISQVLRKLGHRRTLVERQRKAGNVRVDDCDLHTMDG